MNIFNEVRALLRTMFCLHVRYHGVAFDAKGEAIIKACDNCMRVLG